MSGISEITVVDATPAASSPLRPALWTAPEYAGTEAELDAKEQALAALSLIHI